MRRSTTGFSGTERFAIRRQLGSGGMGIVYEAYDRMRNETVALKTLLHVEPSAIYRFKNEFRALADVVHPNLVSLYELVGVENQWFFTMELVNGVSFIEYVRESVNLQFIDSEESHSATPAKKRSESETFPVNEGAATATDQDKSAQESDSETVDIGEQPQHIYNYAAPFLLFPETNSLHIDRLRSAMRQLTEGIYALHKAGKLHRDIKPSNVLVSKEGRVVILDFGLITELIPEGTSQSLQIIGTPLYMSPEQAAGSPLSEASDWYNVGVMLYEALTGRLPFTGHLLEILQNKQQFEPPPPSQLAPGIPEDFDTLCRRLLRREPELRPSGEEILLYLDHQLEATKHRPRPVTTSVTGRPFVGRKAQIAVMEEAFLNTKKGSPFILFVHGNSGIGKSTLVRHFLKELRQREEVVVLTGRCYERETVPYKAFDSLVDALSQYLKRLPPLAAEALLPRDIMTLARLFPVLQQVEIIATANRRVLNIPDSQELRYRAFAALRELLARLADRKPLVIFLDDLQWGDVDSGALLNEILRPPDPPNLLLIASYRSEEAEVNPLLRALLSKQSNAGSRSNVCELEIGELAASEAHELALALLRRHGSINKVSAEEIARESGGSPFFIDELVQYSLSRAEFADLEENTVQEFVSAQMRAISLDNVIWLRISELSEQARRLLEVVAVASQPLDLKVANQAAEIDTEEHLILSTLRARHLVRIRRTKGRDEIETYHDRIRETVIANLSPPALGNYHYRLALLLETSGSFDPEMLARHFHEAGEDRRATYYADMAATQAARALAFDRAAQLYRFAIELKSMDNSDQGNLYLKLGDALANAGRGAEAAEAYLEGAKNLSPDMRLESQRRAAEQLLISGHIDEGLAMIRTVLKAVGLKLAPTPKQALILLLLRRLYLRFRGLKFQERAAEQLPSETLTLIDICWSAAVGLALVDNIRASDFQAQHLLLALKAGEPHRVARALAVEAGFSATSGFLKKDRTDRILNTAKTLAQRIDSLHAQGLCSLTGGVAEYYLGHWQGARELVEHAENVLLEHCTGVTWELNTARLYQIVSLFYQGEIAELSRRVFFFLKESQERGNLYGATVFRTGFANIAWLAADDTNGARRVLSEALSQWSREGFHVEHYLGMQAEAQINLYTGESCTGWEKYMKLYPSLEGSLLLRIQNIRIGMLQLRARLALAASASSTDREKLLAAAEADAGRIERENMTWSNGLAELLRAGITASRGDKSEAMAKLAAAATSFDAAEMTLYAIATQYRRGQLLGTSGRALVEAAEAWMARQQIKNPARMVAMLAPGFADI